LNTAGSKAGAEASAGVAVEDHGRRTLLETEALMDEALQVQVQREVQILARLAVPTIQLLDLAADRIDLEAAQPGPPAQLLLVDLLDAALADPELRQLEQRIAGQLVLRYRPDIPDHVGSELARRVVPEQPGIEGHARQVRPVDRDPGDLGPVQILAHRDRHEGPAPARLGQHLQRALVGQGDQPAEIAERRPEILGLLGNHQDPVGRRVAGERCAVPVEDPAARRRQEPMIDAVLVGEQGILVGRDHLQIVEPAGQQAEQAELAGAEQERAAGEAAQAVDVTMHGSPAGRGCAPGSAAS
jgi:hypothetical protein